MYNCTLYILYSTKFGFTSYVRTQYWGGPIFEHTYVNLYRRNQKHKGKTQFQAQKQFFGKIWLHKNDKKCRYSVTVFMSPPPKKIPSNFNIFPKNSTHFSKTRGFWENSKQKNLISGISDTGKWPKKADLRMSITYYSFVSLNTRAGLFFERLSRKTCASTWAVFLSFSIFKLSFYRLTFVKPVNKRFV